MDRVLDEEPRAREAHLPRVVELVHRLLHGGVQVRVREDQERRLPSELEGDRREVRAGRRGHELAGRHRAGERDPPDVGMRDERGARLLADPLDDVEGAVGHPGVARDVGEERGGERRPLGRLRDHGIPGGERRRDPPRREHQRRVPRRDHHGDAGRDPSSRGSCDRVCRSPRAHRACRDGPRRSGSCSRRAGSPSSSSSGAASRCRGSRPCAISGARSSISSPTRWRISARCLSAIEPQVSKPFFAASTAALASSTPPRATSAIGSSSIGEMSVKVESDGTRSPPIQCSVETSTPSTSTRPLSAVLPETRSYPNGMDDPRAVSNLTRRGPGAPCETERQPIVTVPRMPKS